VGGLDGRRPCSDRAATGVDSGALRWFAFPAQWNTTVEVSQPDKPLTIVLGYDGSEAARRGVSRARELAPRADKLTVVVVAPAVASPSFDAEPLVEDDFDAEALLSEAADLLDGADGMTLERRAAVGDPAAVLMEVAREVDADLLIVGRRGNNFVARALLGSVAERVVQHARCDVLVVS
jgi:nucleotide-binding universal stress UspA family protein